MVFVKICTGTNCAFRGGQAILDALESDPLLHGKVTIEATSCINEWCHDGNKSPVVEIDGEVIAPASVERVSELVFSKLIQIGDD